MVYSGTSVALARNKPFVLTTYICVYIHAHIDDDNNNNNDINAIINDTNINFTTDDTDKTDNTNNSNNNTHSNNKNTNTHLFSKPTLVWEPALRARMGRSEAGIVLLILRFTLLL